MTIPLRRVLPKKPTSSAEPRARTVPVTMLLHIIYGNMHMHAWHDQARHLLISFLQDDICTLYLVTTYRKWPRENLAYSEGGNMYHLFPTSMKGLNLPLECNPRASFSQYRCPRVSFVNNIQKCRWENSFWKLVIYKNHFNPWFWHLSWNFNLIVNYQQGLFKQPKGKPNLVGAPKLLHPPFLFPLCFLSQIRETSCSHL